MDYLDNNNPERKHFLEAWGELVDGGYFTEEELLLVTGINGQTIETLNDCIYCRFGYRSLDDLKESEE